MRRSVTLLLLAAVATAALASPLNSHSETHNPEIRIVPVAPVVAEARSVPGAGSVALPADARSGPLQPSPVDPLQKRDGADHGAHGGGGGHDGGGHGGGGHGGGGHGGGGFGSTGTSSYASAPSSFIGGSGGGIGGSGGHAVGFSSSGGGGGFGGSGGHHGGGGGGFGGSGSSSYSAGAISNHIVGSSGGGGGGGGYGAPPVQPSYGAPPPKQTGYYYYYYPVQVEEDKKGGKGFMDKMKKMFEPMMYPWTAMMEYFGYGEDYDYDYDYNEGGYGTYARSMMSRVSQHVPWDAVNELSNVVTQDQCVEYFVCQLGSYGREYSNMHFLLDYVISEDESNSYTRSFKDSVLKKTDCALYNCPMFRRRQGTPEA